MGGSEGKHCALPVAGSEGWHMGGSEGKHWALLVVGSEGWDNYRHQADVCHAYQVVLRNGIKPENIVVMMFDDIAHNPKNRRQGVIINHPKGVNVYAGVNIDYRRNDVTPANFLAVMRGDKKAMANIGTERVIESGPKDNVFVYFADHGGPNFLAFPSGLLHTKPFIDTIQDMMVIYIEACYSGSMFENYLPDNISVWATTAANAHESSYACYPDENLNTFLGDVYSVMWMEDSDAKDLSKETLEEQFLIVKSKTTRSHVQKYGDTMISKQMLADFQGGTNYVAPNPHRISNVPLNPVASEDVPMAILMFSLEEATSEEEKATITEKIASLKEEQRKIDQLMNSILESALKDSNLELQFVMEKTMALTRHDDYIKVVDYLHENCMAVHKSKYLMEKLRHLLNLCELGIPTAKITKAIDDSHHIVS